mmetsp:Transcript_30350/g.46446  ORF Transcript_30350/g.46446 Transcript_30350/m.46446 type:complete len:183 (+) Transcript_30350:484-1032(+)
MAEENLKDLNINEENSDDRNSDEDEKEQEKIEWYLVDTERTFCRLWNFLIYWVTIYNMLVTPFILIYPELYQSKDANGDYHTNDEDDFKHKETQQTLIQIERVIDIIYCIEIAMNFVKRTRTFRTVPMIAKQYLSGAFVFDVISTLPLFLDENFKFYWLKMIRLIHMNRLTRPLEMLLGVLL